MITEDGTRLHGPRRLLPETLHEYVEIGHADCWLWLGHTDRKGYGRVSSGGAHRAVYTLLVGPIPEGLTLDHLCRVPRCVNPDHLEPVTNAENIRRSPFRRPTHCVSGHPLVGDNVQLRSDGTGRECVPCKRRRSRDSKRSRRLALRLARES